MLTSPAAPTSFDLRFTLLGIPVRISGWFWLVGVILGYSALKEGVEYLVVWLAVLFISILVHEFGHALTAQAFGYRPRVLLYHFGGLAMYEPDSRYTSSRSVLITMAGPMAGFILYGLTQLFIIGVYPQIAGSLSRHSLGLLNDALFQLSFINLFWGLVNLLPVLPLDGGRISQEICLKLNPRYGLLYAARVGVVAGGIAAACLFWLNQPYAALMFVSLVASNYSMMQQRYR